MMSCPSRTIAAAFAALLLAAPAAAQETQGNGTVGAPELRGFRLPGTRVVPPAPTTQPPAPTPEPPAATEPRREAPAAAPAARTSAAPQPQREAPRAAVPPAATPAPARAPVEAPAAAAPAAETSAAEAPAVSLDAFPTAETFPTQDYSGAPATPAIIPPAEDNDEPAFGNLMWPAVAAGLALLAGLFFLQRRRRAALAGDAAVLERASLVETPEPPAPAPIPVRKPILVKEDEDEGLKPVLELGFKPDRMVATDSQATVHFTLTVDNKGKGPARNVRVEARMFSASAQQSQEIAAFLAAPCEIEAAPLTLAPGQGGITERAVTMERQNVREVRIDGRPLFIPTVVVRAVYQWGRARSSQVHGTYVVGIENQKSPDKMGPFRLDMGPRIYRSVGGRKIEPARAQAR